MHVFQLGAPVRREAIFQADAHGVSPTIRIEDTGRTGGRHTGEQCRVMGVGIAQSTGAVEQRRADGPADPSPEGSRVFEPQVNAGLGHGAEPLIFAQSPSASRPNTQDPICQLYRSGHPPARPTCQSLWCWPRPSGTRWCCPSRIRRWHRYKIRSSCRSAPRPRPVPWCRFWREGQLPTRTCSPRPETASRQRAFSAVPLIWLVAHPIAGFSINGCASAATLERRVHDMFMKKLIDIKRARKMCSQRHRNICAAKM
jgi:hypothetical protein